MEGARVEAVIGGMRYRGQQGLGLRSPGVPYRRVIVRGIEAA